MENLFDIFEKGQIHSRNWMLNKGIDFQDISIDPEQPVREEKGLLDYVPLFIGFYSLWRNSEFNMYLMRYYDKPTRIQNPSFFGSFNKVLRPRLGDLYERVVILLIKSDVIYNFADKGYIRFFTDIAVKPEVEECNCLNKDNLIQNIKDNIINERNIYCEIDVYDDGIRCISVPSDIEAIIVDNDKIRDELIRDTTSKYGKNILNGIPIFIKELPR